MDCTVIYFVPCGKALDLSHFAGDNDIASFLTGINVYPVPGGTLFTSSPHGILWAMRAAALVRKTPTGPCLSPVIVPTDLAGCRVYA